MKNSQRWAVADCETDSFDGEAVSPFIWGILTNEGDRQVFWDTRDFIAWVKNYGGKLYAHNGGKFDWMMPEILRELEPGKIKLINGRIASAKIGGTELRDSWLCLPAPLAKFGEKDLFDYSILHRSKRAKRADRKAEIEKYLIQDCVALYNALERFIQKHGFALTQAGAAMKTWEEMGGEKRRYGKTHDEKFRPFYFGGRCEAFEKGAGIIGPFQMFDINSSYPAAMAGEHCAGADYISTTNIGDLIPSSFWHVYGISAGALPFRDDKGRLWFPNDNTPRDYFCTGHEIITAMKFGRLDIIEARGYIPRRFETLKPYVDRFFAEKYEAEQRGDKIGRELAKIFSNSLYGKYAANPETYKDYLLVATGERRDGWELSQICEEHDILERPTARPQYFDVALGASITGQARANLMGALFSSKRPIYCDTDSIVCVEFGGEVGDKLGQWSDDLEGEVVTRAWIAGKKSYAFELSNGKYKTAHKGISKDDIEVGDIKRAAAGEIVEIAKSAPNCKLDGRQMFFSRKLRIT